MPTFARHAVVGLFSAMLVATPALAGVKEQKYDQMTSIAQQMQQLKTEGRGGSALYSTLSAQYASLSASLGGDDPGRRLDVPGDPGPGGPHGTAAAPPGCQASSISGTNNTPAPIPDNNPAGVTSVINVAGAGTYLWDVNLRTFITHTFAGDLDITLTSPAGTVVTITTDNGGSNDDVFNGTDWDDSAGSLNPPGAVTDNTFANLVVETPLVPEEALAAFIGQNPNGNWTLTVVDDAGADTGTLNSWSLDLTTLPAAPVNASPVFGANNTPQAIPDNNPAGITSVINVAGAGPFLCGFNSTTFITHTFAGDLDFTLTSPAGTVVTLSTDNGGSNDNVFNGTLWDDAAGATNPPGAVTDNVFANLVVETPLVAEEALGAFLGENPNGNWTLAVSDDTGADTGTLNSWLLTATTCGCVQACVITAPADITVGNTPGQCGAVVNYPAPTTTGQCGTITCTPPSGGFFPVGTTLVTCSDTSGASDTFNITVNDVQPPVIDCPANIAEDLPPGSSGQNVDFPDPLVSDNCPGVNPPSCVPASGDLFPAGDTVVVCDTLDAAGNTASCTFLVTLNGVTVLEVPTVSSLGLLALALLLAAAAFVALRRNG